MKKSLAILIAIGLVFLVIGSVWNFQRGLMLNSDFWKVRRDGSYTHGKDRVLPSPDGRHFEITLNGKSFTASMAERDENLYIEFSDGWAIELSESDMFSIEVGGILLYSDYNIIPLDFEAMGCQFEKAMPTVSEAFYDEYNQRAGQWHTLMTESGEVIEAWETWDDPEFQAEMGIGRRETQLISEGEPLTSYERFDVLYVNAEGEYLMNPEVLFNIENGYEDIYRMQLARLLMEVANDNPAMRGHIIDLLMFLLFYCLGAAQWLWPEEVAFFGSRWRFRGEPELSDEGLLSVRVGAVGVMIIGIVMLFIPIFA